MVEVTQADRKMAAGYFSDTLGATDANFELIRLIYHGHHDDHPLVQAFARHRLFTSPDRRVMASDVDDLAYSVANAKLGEGPAVRCEPPTEFEIGVAREWVRRVLRAQRAATPVESPSMVREVEIPLTFFGGKPYVAAAAVDRIIEALTPTTEGSDEARMEGERARIVAWHRRLAAGALRNEQFKDFHRVCADAIERGDHLSTTVRENGDG